MDNFNNAEEYLINVKNGVLDVRTLKLLPHDPKYRFTYTYQVDFKKFAGFPPKFACFLRDCFENNADRTRCLEALGYTLSGNKTSKTIWFFVGVANSGKSMLLELLRYIMGQQYVSSIPLDRLEGRFELKSFLNYRANIVGELNNLRLKGISKNS